LIYLYTGTPGSGKSLHMAKEIQWRLKHKKITIANFEVNLKGYEDAEKNFIYKENGEITPEFLKDFSREYYKTHKFKENGICLYLDESQILFNARDWMQKGRENWLSFFTQHRKYGYLIVLVAQFDRMIDRQVRSLVEYEYVHRKISNIGTKGFLMKSGAQIF